MCSFVLTINFLVTQSNSFVLTISYFVKHINFLVIQKFSFVICSNVFVIAFFDKKQQFFHKNELFAIKPLVRCFERGKVFLSEKRLRNTYLNPLTAERLPFLATKFATSCMLPKLPKALLTLLAGILKLLELAF